MAADASKSQNYNDIVTPSEIESYVSNLRKLHLTELGSTKWQNQHEGIEKLNMQAIHDVSLHKDEAVKEALILHNQIQTLIYDLILTEIWKTKIFPEILEMNIEERSNVPLYMTIFHEVTVCSLLEAILYHKEACECAEESILDLLDYCYRKITGLVQSGKEEYSHPAPLSTSLDSHTMAEELTLQRKTIDFDLGIKSIALLKYIIDHMTSLPLSVMDRLLNTYDIPCFLAQLLNDPPWKRFSSKGHEVYSDGKWIIQSSSSVALLKTDGQVWLSLYQLLMSEDAKLKYDMKDYNKCELLKLRRYFTDVLLDQLPCLTDLQRLLENLSVTDTPHVSRSLILEQVPEIRDVLIRQYSGQWKAVAKEQMAKYYSPSDEEMRRQATRLASTYDMDCLERMLGDLPICAVCCHEAMKRCGRCQTQWYCSRECQLTDWSTHRTTCRAL